MQYVYECCECGLKIEATRTIANRRKGPSHCGKRAELVIMPTMIATSFQPYHAIGGDRRYIRSMAEHRDFLKEFNYEEVGNDKSMAPPDISDEEYAFVQEENLKELQRNETEVAESGLDVDL